MELTYIALALFVASAVIFSGILAVISYANYAEDIIATALRERSGPTSRPIGLWALSALGVCFIAMLLCACVILAALASLGSWMAVVLAAAIVLVLLATATAIISLWRRHRWRYLF
jgi:hypothetical protein